MADQVATLGAGCFWGVEYVFKRVAGVKQIAVGFSGGHVKDPSYKQVCTSDTGHVEVAQVTFDDSRITYPQLLEVFWALHDPTQVDRQGPDIGQQYASAIFYHSDEQKQQAEESLLKAQERFDRPIATQVRAYEAFYPAEDYHQDYYAKTGHQPYCHVVPVKELEQMGLLTG